MIPIELLRSRRATLLEQQAQQQAQYQQLEDAMRLLDRQLCITAGALEEIDRLLALEDAAQLEREEDRP
jgi:hypothetical protein